MMKNAGAGSETSERICTPSDRLHAHPRKPAEFRVTNLFELAANTVAAD